MPSGPRCLGRSNVPSRSHSRVIPLPTKLLLRGRCNLRILPVLKTHFFFLLEKMSGFNTRGQRAEASFLDANAGRAAAVCVCVCVCMCVCVCCVCVLCVRMCVYMCCVCCVCVICMCALCVLPHTAFPLHGQKRLGFVTSEKNWYETYLYSHFCCLSLREFLTYQS